MKNAWRGLSSLIPNRSVEDPDDILDEFDDGSMSVEETVSEEQPAEPATPPHAAAAPSSGRRRQLNVVSEGDEESGAEIVPPQKPNVTPLQIDFDLDDVPPAAATQMPVQPAAAQRQPARAAGRRTQPASARVAKTVPEAMRVETNEAEEDLPPIRPMRRVPEPGMAWDQHEEDVRHIAIAEIMVNPNQPRRQFHELEMEELTQSISQHGILQPLVVRRRDDNSYELVAGERRLRAAKQLSWEKVPCVVRKDVRSGSAQLELALIENIQRRDLNPVEEAMAYRQLNEEYGMTHEEIGERVGKSRVGITNAMRVLQLPEEIQQGLVDNKITLGHAKAILMIPDDDKQVRFYRHLVEEGLTVRKAETRARRIQRAMHLDDPARIKRKGRSAYEIKYSGLLEDRYGYDTKVRFNDERNRFEVVFKAFSKEEADELLGRLLGEAELPEAVAADEGDDEMEEE